MQTRQDTPPQPRLLAFCEYLTLRVQTENMELLKRIATEFLSSPSSYKSLDTMVQLSFPLISILPIDAKAPSDREQADELRKRSASLLHDRAHASDSDDMSQFTELLKARVTFKNWDWLLSIYDDFCAGEEDSLVQFVRLQRQAISVIPVRPEGRSAAPLRHAPASEVEVAVNDDDQPDKINRLFAGVENTEQVIAALEEVEKAKPWTVIWDTANIVYPFDGDKYPDIAAKMRQFWKAHGRAVWERNLWARYPTEEKQEERRIRQNLASRMFERAVMIPVFDELGAEFFVNLDRQQTPEHWWWCRGLAVDITRMSADGNLDNCLAYIREQAFRRFPSPGAGFEIRAGTYNPVSVSFWTPVAKYDAQRHEIEKLKRQKTRAKP